MKKERILFVDLGSHYGGVETYIEGLVDILGSRAQIYALCSLPKLATRLRAKNVSVVCVSFLQSKWLKPLRLLLAFFILPCMVIRFQIRTLQLNGYFESFLLVLLRLLGCRTVYTMHGPFETELYSWYRNPARFFPRFISKHCLRFASQIICVSETVGHIATTILPTEKIRVIANWVQPPAVFKKDFLIKAPARLLFVGRVEEYKGIQLILEAMKQIPNISLFVVGDGSYRSQLEEMARNLNVQFAGFQPEPSRYYEDASIFINPSLGPEGLPLVSLEAMAYGLPCLFSDLPVHCEISAGGSAAALFKLGDSNSLAHQLQNLLNSHSLRETLSYAARRIVMQKYSRQVAAEQYLQVFEV